MQEEIASGIQLFSLLTNRGVELIKNVVTFDFQLFCPFVY